MITLRHKIGQMLVMGFNGCQIQDNNPIAQWLSNDGLGGVLLFDKDLSTGLYGKNLKNKPQIKQLISQLNQYAARMTYAEDPLPLLTAIDYEGGAVDRLTKIDGCMSTMSAFDLAKLPNLSLLEEIEQMANTLQSLGFNLNFAPVIDLQLTVEKGIIGKLKRSFSMDPEEVTRVARVFVDIFNRHGIACAYKHFPGHGSAMGDTHEGFVDVTTSFQDAELTPYQQLLVHPNQAALVMTAHVVNKQLDKEGFPATLSHKILTGILRDQMGFDGVIISDDLQMQAIANHYSLADSLRLSINAGADMLIFANQLGHHNAPDLIDLIEQLVFEEKIDKQRIDDAFRRIMRLKQQLKCLDLVES